MIITEKIFDVENETETIIERDATAAEIEAIKKAETDAAKRNLEIAKKNAARAAILEKLGLSEEEAAVLVG